MLSRDATITYFSLWCNPTGAQALVSINGGPFLPLNSKREEGPPIDRNKCLWTGVRNHDLPHSRPEHTNPYIIDVVFNDYNK